MKYVLFVLINVALFQTASAFQFREFDFKEINCMGSNGVSYQVTDSPNSSVQVMTTWAGQTKMFYGNFFVSPMMKNLVVEMGSNESGYPHEFEIIIPVGGVKMGIMQSTGTAWKTALNSRFPLGTVSCSFEMNK